MNKVILVGNLARDPELRQTPAGVSVARFTVAVNRRFAKDGQQQADFINCIAWRQQAEFLCKYFQKGSGIQLCGSIQTRSWDGQDGTRHFATEVIADEIQFNGPKQQNEQTQGTAPIPGMSPNVSAHSDILTDDYDDVTSDEDDLPF